LYRSLFARVCVAAIVIIFSCPVSAADNWRMVDFENDIMVFARPSPNYDSNEFKVVTVINTRIEILVSVLRDIPAFPRWMAHCDTSQLLENKNNNHYLFYFVQNLPWPVKDRDMVIQAITASDWGEGWFKVDFNTTHHAARPPTSSIVRMAGSGFFLLEFIDRQHTQVTFSIDADPAGMVPTFVANRIGRKLTYETMLSMQKFAREKKYILAAEKSKDKLEIEKILKERGISPRVKLVPSKSEKTAAASLNDSGRTEKNSGEVKPSV
jgi:hypothetical protein